MLHLEIQEGKERMARLKYVEEFQATSACTVCMLANLSLSENALTPEKTFYRVVFGDSWFASYQKC
jgi:hypothetical protein